MLTQRSTLTLTSTPSWSLPIAPRASTCCHLGCGACWWFARESLPCCPGPGIACSDPARRSQLNKKHTNNGKNTSMENTQLPRLPLRGFDRHWCTDAVYVRTEQVHSRSLVIVMMDTNLTRRPVIWRPLIHQELNKLLKMVNIMGLNRRSYYGSAGHFKILHHLYEEHGRNLAHGLAMLFSLGKKQKTFRIHACHSDE